MDFDWLGVSFNLAGLSPRDIEESLEDPFSLKLLPEDQADGTQARYYNLGKSLAGRAVFSVFWTDGKRYRIVFARDMTASEHEFFERKKMEEV